MVIHSSGFGRVELQGYTIGMLLQRIALLLMYSNVAFHIPRAWSFSMTVIADMVMQLVALSAALYLSFGLRQRGEGAGGKELALNGTEEGTVSTGKRSLVLWLWASTVLIERVGKNLSSCLLARGLVPINIDHYIDREGAFVMVVLGESVLSEAINYRSLPPEARGDHGYIIGSLLGFLTTFSLALLYFHVQPERHESGYRTSRARGLGLI